MIHGISMSNVTPLRRPINWRRLRQDEAERIIRSRAGETGNVVFTFHTDDRSDERDFTRSDIFQMLRAGHCLDAPARNENGDWQVIGAYRLAGSRDAGAVTVILEDQEKLVIRTVEWMDLR